MNFYRQTRLDLVLIRPSLPEKGLTIQINIKHVPTCNCKVTIMAIKQNTSTII